MQGGGEVNPKSSPSIRKVTDVKSENYLLSMK